MKSLGKKVHKKGKIYYQFKTVSSPKKPIYINPIFSQKKPQGIKITSEQRKLLDSLCKRYKNSFTEFTEFEKLKKWFDNEESESFPKIESKIIKFNDLKNLKIPLSDFIERVSSKLYPSEAMRIKLGKGREYTIHGTGYETNKIFTYHPKRREYSVVTKFHKSQNIELLSHKTQNDLYIIPDHQRLRSRFIHKTRLKSGWPTDVVQQEYAGPALSYLEYIATPEEKEKLKEISKNFYTINSNFCYNPRTKKLLRVDYE